MVDNLRGVREALLVVTGFEPKGMGSEPQIACLGIQGDTHCWTPLRKAMTGYLAHTAFYIACKSGPSPALRKRNSNRTFPFVPILCLIVPISGLAEILFPLGSTQGAAMQKGSLIRSSRRQGPDVWEYRWRESSPGEKRKHRRIVIGSVDTLKDESSALKAITALR